MGNKCFAYLPTNKLFFPDSHIHISHNPDHVRGGHQRCDGAAAEAGRRRRHHVLGGVHYRGVAGDPALHQVLAGPGLCICGL